MGLGWLGWTAAARCSRYLLFGLLVLGLYAQFRFLVPIPIPTMALSSSPFLFLPRVPLFCFLLFPLHSEYMFSLFVEETQKSIDHMYSFSLFGAKPSPPARQRANRALETQDSRLSTTFTHLPSRIAEIWRSPGIHLSNRTLRRQCACRVVGVS